MKIVLFAALGVALSGCITGSGQFSENALQNLQHCERTYQATIGALGAPGGALFIKCPARPYDTAAPAEPLGQ